MKPPGDMLSLHFYSFTTARYATGSKSARDIKRNQEGLGVFVNKFEYTFS